MTYQQQRPKGSGMGDRFRSLEDDSFDVIVVGAGMGGLSAAALLAKRGYHVLVLDRHYVAGGNATVFRRPGYEFDVGLHYIGECKPDGGISRTLRAAGVEDFSFIEMDKDAFDVFHFPDFSFSVPSDLDLYRQRLLDLFPEERRGIDRYMKMLRQADRIAKIPGKTTWQTLRTLLSSPLPLRYLFSDLGSFLDTCTDNPKLRAILTGNQIIYTQPERKVSAMMHLFGFMHYMHGPGYPKGGGQILSDKLADAIEASGSKLLLRAEVEEILVEKGRVYGVKFTNRHTGTRIVRAPIVISNADIKHTFFDLFAKDAVPKKTRAQVSEYEMSPGLGVVYLGLKEPRPLSELPNQNICVFPEYDVAPLYEATARGEHVDDLWCCVTVASTKDPENTRLAPEGVLNVQLMGLAPSQASSWGVDEAQVKDHSYRKEEAYKQAKEDYAQRLLKQAERVWPDLHERIVFQEVATPLTHRRYTNATDGTGYGIALLPSQYLWRRPDYKTPIKGFYLCGASARGGHGIPGVLMSGIGVAQAITGLPLERDIFGASSPYAAETW